MSLFTVLTGEGPSRGELNAVSLITMDWLRAGVPEVDLFHLCAIYSYRIQEQTMSVLPLTPFAAHALHSSRSLHNSDKGD